MKRDAKIFVAGARGLVGSALVRELRARGYENIMTPNREELNLVDPVQTRWWFSVIRPEYVFLAAARVGGIKANDENPLQFFLENMAIETNVICNASEYGVLKLLFLGSSCIYPKLCPQPIKEEYLLTGAIEPTTEPYALAKICGIRLCDWHRRAYEDNFVSAMPPNLFGENDNFDPQYAHCLPGLIARLHQAKLEDAPTFSVWGDGSAKREFLLADDLAKALLVVMDKYDEAAPINTGSGMEITIGDLAIVIAGIVGYRGKLVFNPDAPVGTPRKVLDNSKITALGWRPQVKFLTAVQQTYDWYKLNVVLP